MDHEIGVEPEPGVVRVERVGQILGVRPAGVHPVLGCGVWCEGFEVEVVSCGAGGVDCGVWG